jgi:long-chain acyl-CoA synthetase
MASELGFWTLAQADPGHLALVTPDGEERSAGDVLGVANQLVHGLRALGLQRGATVAVLLPNDAEFIELFLAIGQAGWYLVPINTHLVGPEVAYIVNDSEAEVFISHERFAEAASVAAKDMAIPSDHRFSIGTIPGFRPYGDLLDGQPTSLPAARATGNVMNYTSGTTGQPKGVRRALPDATPEAMSVASGGMLLLFGLAPHDDNVHIVGSPLYHTAVLAFASGALHLGHTLVIMDKWSGEAMLERIERWRVTNSHMVPTQFHRLLALPDDVKQRYDVSSLRHMIHAAAPCPIDTKRQMIDWWGSVIDEYYAASEGGGSYVTAAEWMTKPGTVGRPWPNAELAIYNDEGVRLTEPHQIGTIYMKMGNAPNFEYHKDKEKTEKNRRDGFFTVGDVGELDDDGWLFLRDRKIDMIISGGANIYPSEIESVLLTCPLVGDAAVFGVPNDDWGEEVKAVVEPAAGQVAGPELAAAILAYCNGRLARFKMPKTLDFTDAMPRDPNGKLYKRKLRDPYWAGRATAI